jgi:hypothetical protein
MRSRAGRSVAAGPLTPASGAPWRLRLEPAEASDGTCPRIAPVTGHFLGRGIWDSPSCAPAPTRSVPAEGSASGAAFELGCRRRSRAAHGRDHSLPGRAWPGGTSAGAERDADSSGWKEPCTASPGANGRPQAGITWPGAGGGCRHGSAAHPGAGHPRSARPMLPPRPAARRSRAPGTVAAARPGVVPACCLARNSLGQIAAKTGIPQDLAAPLPHGRSRARQITPR